jgi:hypothetical protein
VALKGRHWLGIATAVWALAVAVTAYVAARTGTPTAREQTTLAEARATVDQAVIQVAASAGNDVVTAISGYDLSTGCRITSARRGTSLDRVIRLYTAAGTEPALLKRLAQALPRSYHAGLTHRLTDNTPTGSPSSGSSPAPGGWFSPGGSAAPGSSLAPSISPTPGGSASLLRADAGDYVGLRGEVSGPGEVRVEVDGGCRTGSDLGVAATNPEPTPSERAPALAALAALSSAASSSSASGGALGGARADQWRTYQATCPKGGTLRTTEVISQPFAVSRPLPELLRASGPALGSPTIVLAEPQRYAYSTGTTGMAIRADTDSVTITATTPCP